MRRKNFRVPNRDIKISRHELLFINTRCFQRLYDIKQLGLADRIYPFATHTRGAHCLDCLDMSQRFIDALIENMKYSISIEEGEYQRQLERITKDTDLIRAAALLHDIMHIPYTHTLEDENDIFEKGDKGIRIDKMIDRIKDELQILASSPELASHILFGFENQEELNKTIKDNQKLLEDIKKVLWTIGYPDDDAIKESVEKKAKKVKRREGRELSEKEKSEERKKIEKRRLDPDMFYIADIIGNTISADLLSYILRDVEFTGIEMKPGFWYRLFDYLEIKGKDGMNRLVIRLTKKGDWRQDVLSAIIGILNVRYSLTEVVIYHHAKCEASAMLGKIVSLCNLVESDKLYDLGDEGFMNLLEEKVKDMINNPSDSKQKERAEGAKMLLSSLRSRRFYKRFHVVPISGQKGYGKIDLSAVYSLRENRFDLEENLEKEFGLKPGSIIVFCPTGKMALKEAEVLVVYEKIGNNGELEEVIAKLDDDECLENLRQRHQSLGERVKNVVDQYMALWKLYVFVDPNLIPIYGEVIKKRLLSEIGEGDSIFDRSYVYPRNEYEVSKTLEEKVRSSVPEHQIPAVFREIPSAIEVRRKREQGEKISWIKYKADEIVEHAINLMKSRGKQGELPL